MAGSTDTGVCKRIVSTHHALCELPAPCPLHDVKKVVRAGQFSLMRFVERMVGALLTGLVLAYFNRC